jgi:hypothetical protein
MKSGTYKQGTPPYGYDIDDGKLVVNKEAGRDSKDGLFAWLLMEWDPIKLPRS